MSIRKLGLTSLGKRLSQATVAMAAFAVPNAFADVATSSDDVCPSSSNPCIVSVPVDVDAAHPLDFGLRTVHVTNTGRFQGTLDLYCGAFVTDGPAQWLVLGPDTAA